MEATIAIMIFSSVLLIIYSQQTTTTDLGDNIYVIQKKVLNEISLNEDLRNKVLEGDKNYLNEFTKNYFPFYLNYSFEICDLTNSNHVCTLKLDDYTILMEKNVFVEDTIIAANLTDYSPKIVRIFVWEA